MDSVWVLWCRSCNYWNCSTLHGCQLPTHFYSKKRMTMSIGFDFGPSSASSIEIDKFIMFFTIRLFLLFFIIWWVLPFVQCEKKQKKKRYVYIHTVVDNKCETLLLLAKGTFHGPVAEQTRSKKNTVVPFWRRRELFTLEMKKIHYISTERRPLTSRRASGSVAKTF